MHIYTFQTEYALLSSIRFAIAKGKEGVIDFTSGSDLRVVKTKNGHLSVVRLTHTLMMRKYKAKELNGFG